MPPIKSFLKSGLNRLGLISWLDTYLFIRARFANRKKNLRYLEKHPGLVLPDEYALYETYQLDYQLFMEDGLLAASELVALSKPYLTMQKPRLLDWGCGVGRMCRHFPSQLPDAEWFGCDTNSEYIYWNRQVYGDVQFSVTGYHPPTHYPNAFFDALFGMSVLTHIEDSLQEEWIKELYRIVQPGGILILSTQGNHYANRLLPQEKKALTSNGVYTRQFEKKGHRMMSTYHSATEFRKMLATYFTIIDFWDGALHPQKIGGQDLWILKKNKQ